ncbi:MAG TPA: hypothetical protein VFA35_06865 [Burkholderiaceae bacterium]|nr:hypothetical protein [Burkholderiaceae bacterium]
MQTLIVALLVIGCGAYAAWTLMPAAARRALASSLLRLPLPAALAAKLRKAATVSSGCGCDGCDRAPATTSPRAPQVVNFHPRSKR